MESIVVKPKILLKKKKRGRPFEGGRDPVIGLRLSQSETSQIDALAEKEGVKRSEMIRRLIDIGLATFAKGTGRAG
jgi:hypothetical protein